MSVPIHTKERECPDTDLKRPIAKVCHANEVKIVPKQRALELFGREDVVNEV